MSVACGPRCSQHARKSTTVSLSCWAGPTGRGDGGEEERRETVGGMVAVESVGGGKRKRRARDVASYERCGVTAHPCLAHCALAFGVECCNGDNIYKKNVISAYSCHCWNAFSTPGTCSVCNAFYHGQQQSVPAHANGTGKVANENKCNRWVTKVLCTISPAALLSGGSHITWQNTWRCGAAQWAFASLNSSKCSFDIVRIPVYSNRDSLLSLS